MNRAVENPQIGNWYLVDGEPTKITIDNIIPASRTLCLHILLTEEILRKNGFISTSGRWVFFDEENHISVTLKPIVRDGVIKRSQSISVVSVGVDTSLVRYLDEIYVDQLQDILKVMAVNKTIEL
jgi:hypothetical protein